MKEQVQGGVRGDLARIGELSRAAVWQAAAVLFGFLTARTSILGDYAPFGLAFAAGTPAGLTAASALGAAAGYLIPVTGQNAFRYLAAVFAIAAVKLLIPAEIRMVKSAFFPALITLAASLVTAGAAAAVGGVQPMQLILYAAEGLLASAGAYFFRRASALLRRARGLRGLSQQELASAVIAASILLMSLTPLSVGGVSFARTAAVVFVLAAARYGREPAGAIAGVAAGFAMSLPEGGSLLQAASYSLGGLMAGVFAPLGSLGCAAAFLLSNGVVSLRAGGSVSVITGLYEVFAATVLFLVLPRGVRLKISEFFSPAPEMPRLDGLRRAVGMRLEFASDALSDVSETVEEVSAKLGRIGAPAFEDIFTRVELETCAHCGLRVQCWETERARTLASMVDITKALRAGRPPEEAAEDLADRCSRVPALCESLRENFRDYTAKRAAQQRIDEVRSVVSDQFRSVSEMLGEMAVEFEQSQRYDVECAQRCDAELRALGVSASDIGCSVDKFGRMTVEIRVQEADRQRINKSEVMRRLSAACGRELDVPCVSDAGRGVLITLTERAQFSVEYGVAQIPCGQARLCGDACSCFNDGRGRAVFILSDGMGTGGRAAVDGAMASGLMGRLLRAGFGFDCSLRMVNSAMLFKSTDESLATLDVTCLDLFTGRADLYKAGACPTIIRRKGRAGKAECSSLPAGILRDVGFDCAGVTLGQGDIVVMASDGAVSEGADWICAELEKWENGTAQQLADHLAAGARRRRQDGHEDDVTVLAAILGQNY